MQFWILNIIFLACCAMEASSLECFECTGDECNNMNDSMLNNCGPQDTTASPPPTPPTISSTAVNTQTSSDKWTSTTTSTEGSTSETTSGTTKGSTSETTSATTKDSTSETTSETTSVATSETKSEATSENTESTKSPTVSTSDDIPETTIASTSLPTETIIAIEETSPPRTQVQNVLIRSERQRRSLVTNAKILPADVLLANYRSRTHNGRADSSYYCYSASIPDGDSSKQKLGCVKVAANQEPCDVVRELNNIPTNTDTNYYCNTCQTDKCNNNGAGHFQGISMLTLLAILIVQKFCK